MYINFIICKFINIVFRVLQDVESNTIRLKEQEQDVLVLERIPQINLSNHNPGLQSTSNGLSTAGNVAEKRPQYW